MITMLKSVQSRGLCHGNPKVLALSRSSVRGSRLIPHASNATKEQELQVSRVSEEAASRKGTSKAFTRLLGLEGKLAQPTDLDPETLKDAPKHFPAYTVPLSDLRASISGELGWDLDVLLWPQKFISYRSHSYGVQKLRPYFFNRTFTDADVGYAAFFIAMHAAALIGGPLTYSPDALAVCLGGYVLTGMFGVSLSYHRQLSHMAFRTPKWLEFTLAYCGVLAFEGDPVEWVKNHRWHHLHSDTPTDRHSPKDGLWYSHMGWLFDEQLNSTRKDAQGNMKDSLAAPWFYKESPEFYGWIRKTYMWHQLGQALLMLAWGGVPFFIWGFVIRVLLTMHMTWLVNSAVHIWGDQPYDAGDGSRNNPLVALLVFGDGWHNNHHAFEYSAGHGLEWWEVDFSYYFVCLLERCGLAWDVKRVTEAQKKSKRRAQTTAV